MTTNISELGYILRLDAPAPSIGASALTSAGIQAQIDALDSKVGGTIQLEAATYTLTAPVIINKANCSIKGVDEKATRINFAYDGIAFDVQAIDAEISDLTITGPAHSLAPLSTAFKISSTGTGHISDLNITGCKFAFYNNGVSEATTIENVTYSQTGTATCGSFLLSERADALATDVSIHVSACTISDCKDDAITIKHSKERTHIEGTTIQNIANGKVGVKIGSAEGSLLGVRLDQCQFIGTNTNGYCVDVLCSAAQVIGQIAVSDCAMRFSGALRGIRVDLSNITGSMSIIGNTFAGAIGAAIELSNVVQSTITGNVGTLTDGGALKTSVVQRMTFLGNVFTNNVNHTLDLSNVSRSTISNNRLENTGTGQCIRCAVVGGNNVVSGNTCISASDTAIFYGSAVSGTITGNTCITVTGGGITVSSANKSVVSSNRVYVSNAASSVPGILITGSTDVVCSANNVEHATVAQPAIQVIGGSNFTISGNICNRTTGGLGLDLDNADNATVIGNVFRTTSANGAQVGGGTTNVTSFGNQLTGGWTGADTAQINPAPITVGVYDLAV